MIDFIAIVLIISAVFVILGILAPAETQSEDGGLAGAIGLLAVLILPGVYLSYFEAASGQTPGKRAAGLRVVRLDGQPRLGRGAANVRYLWRLVSLLVGGLGYVWAFGPNRRTWHDLLTNTAVIGVETPVIVEGASPAPRAAVRVSEVRGSDSPELQPVDARVEPSAPAPPDRLIALADALKARHHFEEAAILLVAALNADRSPDGPGWTEAALLLIDAGRPPDALSIVNRVLLTHPTDARAVAVKSLAILQLGDAGNAEALALGRRAVLHDPNDPLCLVALAFALHRSEIDAEAEEILAREDFGEEQLRAHLCRRSIALRRKDREAVELWSRAAAEIGPFNAALATRVANACGHATFSGRVAMRRTLAAFSGLFWITPRLQDRARALAESLSSEPQSDVARELLRTLPTGGERGTWEHVRRLTTIASSAFLIVFVSIPWLANRARVSDAATPWVSIRPWSLAFFVALCATGALHLSTYARQRRMLDRGTLGWLRYVRGLHDVRVAQQRKERSPNNRRIRIPKTPEPPKGTVLEQPASCHCEGLNFLYGDVAIAYARLHLAQVRDVGGWIFELSCPSTLAPWLLLEAAGEGPTRQPVRLCRISEAPAFSESPHPGQYL